MKIIFRLLSICILFVALQACGEDESGPFFLRKNLNINMLYPGMTRDQIEAAMKEQCAPASCRAELHTQPQDGILRMDWYLQGGETQYARKSGSAGYYVTSDPGWEIVSVWFNKSDIAYVIGYDLRSPDLTNVSDAFKEIKKVASKFCELKEYPEAPQFRCGTIQAIGEPGKQGKPGWLLTLAYLQAGQPLFGRTLFKIVDMLYAPQESKPVEIRTGSPPTSH